MCGGGLRLSYLQQKVNNKVLDENLGTLASMKIGIEFLWEAEKRGI